jgi:hypothetical protein
MASRAWRRVTDALSRLRATSAELEAGELVARATSLGATPIADVADRQSTVICGEVRAVSLRPQVQVPAYIVDVSDGSGVMQLVWLGRRQILGIEPGVVLRVTGRPTFRRGVATMFNPVYDVIAQHG